MFPFVYILLKQKTECGQNCRLVRVINYRQYQSTPRMEIFLSKRKTSNTFSSVKAVCLFEQNGELRDEKSFDKLKQIPVESQNRFQTGKIQFQIIGKLMKLTFCRVK